MEVWGFLVTTLVVISTMMRRVEGTMYTVGGTSGWDISTDIDSWAQDKNFLIGDTLWFQFSSYESVAELRRKDFNKCSSASPISINKSGNATFPLTTAGDRFFASGNSMYCLSGLKLQVHVVDPNQTTTASPVSSPAAPGPTSSLPPASTKNNNPFTTSFGTRTFSIHGPHATLLSVFLAFFCPSV